MGFFLIFEAKSPARSPGAVTSSGGMAGSGMIFEPDYKPFSPLLIVSAPAGDWQAAIQEAVRLTRRLGEYYAVECNMLPQEFLTEGYRLPPDAK